MEIDWEAEREKWEREKKAILIGMSNVDYYSDNEIGDTYGDCIGDGTFFEDDWEAEESEKHVTYSGYNWEEKEREKLERVKKAIFGRSRSMKDMIKLHNKNININNKSSCDNNMEQVCELKRSRSTSDMKLVDRHYYFAYYDSDGHYVVYDRTTPPVKPPADPEEIVKCTDLAKLAIRFFNKDNPHMPFSEDSVELVKASRDYIITGATYYLTFIAMSHSQPKVFSFLESEIWSDEEDGTSEVYHVNIIDFW